MTEEQAVSKWESEQSAPDIEKIILLSDYFEVTTDYLLKGIESVADETADKADARIFSVVGTALNFIGLVAAIMIWVEEQRPISVAVGLIIMAIGCMIFAVGQFIGENRKKAAFLFVIINVWLVSLMPISCIFNCIQGVLGGYWWTFAPTPQMGNYLSTYGLCWLIYFILCLLCDIVMVKSKHKWK